MAEGRAQCGSQAAAARAAWGGQKWFAGHTEPSASAQLCTPRRTTHPQGVGRHLVDGMWSATVPRR